MSLTFTPPGVALAVAALFLLAVSTAVRARQIARTEALRQYRRREESPAVRQLVADILEDCNAMAAEARRPRGLR